MKDFELNPKKYISFIIITPKGRKSLNIRFSFQALIWIICSLALLTIFISGSFFYVSKSSFQLSQQKTTQKKNQTQEKQIQLINQEITNLKNKLESLLSEESELRYLIGERASSKKKLRKKISLIAQTFQKIEKNSSQTLLSSAKKLIFLEQITNEFQVSFQSLHKKIVLYKKRFDATPSIWPVYGRILSRYGWRTHPITRRRQFHKGVDIPCWLGAPIKATADGVVIFNGWAGGYGLAVILDHGYGYRTVYAHASKILTKKGAIIKKGQVIATIGSTGISTGPHIHYEITRWGKAIKPNKYLDLDLFTASTRIW